MLSTRLNEDSGDVVLYIQQLPSLLLIQFSEYKFVIFKQRSREARDSILWH